MSIAQSLNNSQLQIDCARILEELKVCVQVHYLLLLMYCFCCPSFMLKQVYFMKRLNIGTKLHMFILKQKTG